MARRTCTRTWDQVSRQIHGHPGVGGYDLELEPGLEGQLPVFRMRAWDDRGQHVREITALVDPGQLLADLQELVGEAPAGSVEIRLRGDADHYGPEEVAGPGDV